jgi:uncharacterized protein YcbK (DUF882 family)
MFDKKRWPNFSESELSCKHCKQSKFSPEFLDKLQRLRGVMNAPLKISSAYRCPEHNQAVSSTGPDGPHTTGRAVDIKTYGAEAQKIIFVALNLGFTGIGVNQKGPVEKRFIHLDDLPNSPRFQRPTIWSY